LFFNKGDFGGCSKFVDVSSKQSVGCGVARFEDLTFDGRTYENYIGVGKVTGLKYEDGKMLMEMIMPWGEKFGYKLKIELDKRPDGKHDIGQEKVKRYGYFDHFGLLKFDENEVENIRNEILGKEMMFKFYADGGDERYVQWRSITSADNYFEYFLLSLKGLFGLNNLYAIQAGY